MAEQDLKLEQRGFEYGVKHLLSPRAGDLLNILAEVLAVSQSEIQEWLWLGAIYVRDQRCLENCEITQDTYVRVHTKPRRFQKNDHAWKSRLAHEEEDFLVVRKPAALSCHPSVDNIRENVLAYLSEDLERELFLTHRLDVPTSGLLVIAKNKTFQSSFNKMLKDRQLSKIYQAVCQGPPPTLGLQRHYMVPSPRAPKKVLREEKAGHQLCELNLLSLEDLSDGNFRARIELLTGRTHQIRVQMAALGSPIRGDWLYGGEKIYAEERIDLTACELSFENPRTGKKHHFKI
jgi:23S rRNA pseudouridine1911/1915/1917 synthase